VCSQENEVRRVQEEKAAKRKLEQDAAEAKKGGTQKNK
jgi:hypothetical protein